MAKKDLLVKITVNNSGLDFSDDVSIVLITVDAELDKSEVSKRIHNMNLELQKEDEDGECYYAYHGYNAEVLLNELEVRYGWHYKYLIPEIEETI